MNILFVTQYFYPENFRINDLCIELQKKGYDITVLTAIPNYPNGKIYSGYGYINMKKEVYNNIKIFRSPIIPRGNNSNFMLALNYISFVIGGLLRALFLLNNKYDLIFVFQASPVTSALPAIFLKKIKKIPICMWVVDLWPESITSTTNINPKLVHKILSPLVKYIYENCNLILASSNGFIKSIDEMSVHRQRIEYFPQWAESIFKPITNSRILLQDIPEKSFKVMFAGNIGEAQDFPAIIKAATLLKHKDNIHWVILGSGRKDKWLQAEIKKNKLNNTFHLLGRSPIEKMPEYYSHADCMLFSLKKSPIFSITMPGKVQSYLACAKPIVSMADGEASDVIMESNSGLVCPSGDYKMLAKNVVLLSHMKKEELSNLGKNGLKYYNSHFSRDHQISRAQKYFSELLPN